MAKPKKRLFLVDADAAYAEMLRAFIEEKFNVDVLSFTNVDDALRNLAAQNPIYVLLDYNPGDAASGDLLQRVRQAVPAAHTIVLSSQEKIDVAANTMKHGAFDYVVKNPSAFLRVENDLKHIDRIMRAERSARSYRNAAFVLLGLLLLFALVAWLLLQNGTTSEQGM